MESALRGWGKEIALNRTTLSLILVLALAAFSIPAAADHHEGGPPVINVLMFDVGTNAAQFIAFTKRASEIQTTLGNPGEQRVWAPLFGAQVAGVVIVTVEYPSLVAMAQAQAKSNASPEWQAFVQEVGAAGIRLVSNSVAADAAGN